MDYLTELLRKDQLDETISLESLEKSLNFFHHLYNVHLASDEPGNQPLHCTELLTNHIRLMNAAADCIHTDLSRLKFMCPPPSGEPNDIADLFKVKGGGGRRRRRSRGEEEGGRGGGGRKGGVGR